MTRTMNGERLFQDAAKEILRKQLWQIADYCGVQILTYAILSNHFHVLLAVPKRGAVSDAELLRRYGTLWVERFKSVLVEPHSAAVETMAAYIDLNCVRAGLAQDPKD
jgi:putative transposase